MGTVFNKTLCAILVTTSLVACNKDDSKNNNDGDLRPLNVTTATVAGIWEVDGYYLNGAQVNPANNAQLETIQYEITDKRIAVVTSKNKVMTARFTALYTIENNRIVTKDNRNSSMHDLDILKVTANTMHVRALPQQSPGGDSTWSLRRIDASQLVGGSVLIPTPGTQPAVDQYLQMDMITPSLKFSKVYKQLGNGNSDVELACNYDEASSSLSVSLRSFKQGRSYENTDRDLGGRGQTTGRGQGGRDDGGRTSGIDPQGHGRDDRDDRDGRDDLEAEVYILARPLVMNLNSPAEILSVAFGRGRSQQHPPFLATFDSKLSKKIYFSMNRDSRCDLSVSRNGDVVDIAGSCTNLDANGAKIEGRSRINLKGNCLLQAQ